MKIRKNDEVVVIAGDDKGKVGKVLEVNSKAQTVIVKDVNKVTKHKKPSQENTQGEIVVKEAPIHVSKVAILVKKASKDKPAEYSKIGFRVENGKKVRFAKKTKKVI
ncbi:50S ribosomal protein L24 [Mesomycoplasma conjunctivae]|uniref:Large ribosomal subunit protein uL24 n=1 Tax=Mesomycoplasma conjunctivae (strain ATCC 25834 / NCTC 10147 / HRC/581) TaxID=572263 RepID=C5J5U3_MESCH|nr:50S ribosomal protein L24 [Mesomycoplasma conjunctivae]CAT04832.1 50S ribosomal protein L24 [Mesomycoplasma conjunctivae]VEU65879.1 50S ribosomal protein L24 [Mesomycoplasma conjunctivae]